VARTVAHKAGQLRILHRSLAPCQQSLSDRFLCFTGTIISRLHSPSSRRRRFCLTGFVHTHPAGDCIFAYLMCAWCRVDAFHNVHLARRPKAVQSEDVFLTRLSISVLLQTGQLRWGLNNIAAADTPTCTPLLEVKAHGCCRMLSGRP